MDEIRAARFLEEALELAQAEGLSIDFAGKIMARVYARAPGNVTKEIGQAQATLEVLAENLNVSAYREAAREFDRVRTIPKEHWAKRHAAKVYIGIAN